MTCIGQRKRSFPIIGDGIETDGSICKNMFAYVECLRQKIKHCPISQPVKILWITFITAISTNRKYYSFTLIIICLIAGAFIFNDSFYFYSIIIPNFLYHLYLIIEPSEEMLDVKMKKNITAIALFIVLVLIYSYWGYNDASCLKEQYTSKVISFDNVSTADNIYKYIGETSGYYFILNSQNNDVLVINKGGIDKIKVETNKFRENEQKQAQKKVDEFINKVKDFLDSNKR